MTCADIVIAWAWLVTEVHPICSASVAIPLEHFSIWDVAVRLAPCLWGIDGTVQILAHKSPLAFSLPQDA